MITIQHKVHLGQGRRGKKELRSGEQTPPDPVGRVPRISKLMALAIRFDQLIRDGIVVDQAELARLGHVSRARVTQIMNLLNLAPDIQESILLLTQKPGRATLCESAMRPVAADSNWQRQRSIWRRLAPPQATASD